MTNIHDIAKLSGYSVGTVSRVLNDARYVSQPARHAVMRAIKATGYVPNHMAQALSVGSMKTIGIVVPDIEQPMYNTLLKGAAQYAQAHQHQVILLQSGYNQAAEHQFLHALRNHTVDGLIFSSHELPLSEIVEALAFGPIVVCQDPHNISIPAVYPERINSYISAFNWCHAQQLKRIGLVLGRSVTVSATSQAIRQAYRQVFARPPFTELSGIMTFAQGYANAKQLFRAQVDAVLTSSDDVGAGISEWFCEHQQKAPVIIGQDRQLSGQLLNLPKVDHHIETLGQQAMAALINGQAGKVELPSEFCLHR